MKLKTNCLFTKLLIVMLSLFLMFSAVSPKVYADAGKSLENESDTITVCVSMEKFTLGQGYIIEPTLVKVKEGTLASVVITDLLKARYPDIPQPWRMTGSIDNSFYLSAVYDPNRGTPSIPQYILDHAKVDVDRCTEDWLGEFDYYSMSGWMYCVNGKFPNVGAAAWPMKDGEVMRWQFTLYGYDVALTELGIPLNDPRFVKNGNTLLDNLMGFYQPGKGFSHTQGGDGSNMMATEQAFYGLVAARRAKKGENSLYRMGDAIKVANSEEDAIKAGEGLKNKHPDVKAQPIIYFEKTFEDISGANAHANYVAIEALAARGIISGKTDTTFDPDATMTRAEFAAIVVRGLGLVPKTGDKFADTPKDAWYSGYVGTANAYGIVKGVTDTTFNPTGVITREEAAVMVARAAALCGMDTEVDPGELRDILAQFGDYIKTSEWSRAALTFCYKEGVLDETDLNIRAKAPIKRSK